MGYTRAMDDSVLAQICRAIVPACSESARAARDKLAQHEGESLGNLEQLAARLAGARHSAEPDVARKHVIVCVADHGTALGSTSERDPTQLAARQIAAGAAAVNAVARTAGATVMVIDCGSAYDGPGDPAIIDLRVGPGTGDIRQGPAMPRLAALASIQTGIAFMLSLADAGTDCVALGAIAPGSLAAASALVAALTGRQPDNVEAGDRMAIAAALKANDIDTAHSDGNELDSDRAIDLLAALGGYEIGAMTGIILAAASLQVPIVLDEHDTSSAALVARYLAPNTTGYLIASHLGQSEAHRRATSALDLSTLFDLGLAYGEGTGAALALPLIESAARLLNRRSQ